MMSDRISPFANAYQYMDCAKNNYQHCALLAGLAAEAHRHELDTFELGCPPFHVNCRCWGKVEWIEEADDAD